MSHAPPVVLVQGPFKRTPTSSGSGVATLNGVPKPAKRLSRVQLKKTLERMAQVSGVPVGPTPLFDARAVSVGSRGEDEAH